MCQGMCALSFEFRSNDDNADVFLTTSDGFQFISQELVKELVNLQRGRRNEAGEIGDLKAKVKQLQSFTGMHTLVKELFEDLRSRLAFKAEKGMERNLAPPLLMTSKVIPRESNNSHLYLSSPSFWSTKPPWLDGTLHGDRNTVRGTCNLLEACRDMVKGLEDLEERTLVAKLEDQKTMRTHLHALAVEKEELQSRLEAAEDALKEVSYQQHPANAAERLDVLNTWDHVNKSPVAAPQGSMEGIPEFVFHSHGKAGDTGSPSPSSGSSGITDVDEEEETHDYAQSTPGSVMLDTREVLESGSRGSIDYEDGTAKSYPGRTHGELREMWTETNALRNELAEEKKGREQERRSLKEHLKISTDELASVQEQLKEMQSECWSLTKEVERQAKAEGQLEAELEEREEELSQVGVALERHGEEVNSLREKYMELEGELRRRRVEVADVEGCLKSASAVLEELRMEGVATTGRLHSDMCRANERHIAEIQTLQELVDSTNRELEMAMGRGSEGMQRTREAEERWREAERENEEKAKSLKLVHEAYERKKGEAQSAKMAAEDLREEEEKLQLQVAGVEEDGAVVGQVDELKQLVDKLEEELCGANLERDEAREKRSTLVRCLEELREEAERRGEELEEAWKVSASLQTSLEDTNESLARYRGEADALSAETVRQKVLSRSRELEVVALKAEVEAAERVAGEKSGEVEDVGVKLKQAVVQLGMHEEAEEMLRREAEGLRERHDRVSDMLRSAQAENEGLLSGQRDVQCRLDEVKRSEGMLLHMREQLKGAEEEVGVEKGEKKKLAKQ